LSPAGYRAYDRALSTLDFDTTPDNDSRMIMNSRLAMLYEILARIELPPDSEIPGDEEVAQSVLNQWTIPGTDITIQRIEKGPRAGEFLFSAWTVNRLHRFYRMVKHLPYRPDAAPGVYEASLRSKSSISYLEGPVRNRLKPIDTSSPRSTFDGFFDSVNRVYALVMEADAALKASSPTITRAEAREIEITALNLMQRAKATLDLSKVPRAIRDDVGIESVLQLKEIFDRMHLPHIESVPDMEMVKAERQRLSRTALGNTRPVRWRYPNTAIEIVEIMDGEQQGKFLFSANTVLHLNEFYEKVRDLSYRGDQYSQVALEYSSPETSKGFYEYYISTPGDLIPLDSFWGRLVEGLPGWFKTMYGGQTVWQWISLALSLSLGVLFLVALQRHPSASARQAFGCKSSLAAGLFQPDCHRDALFAFLDPGRYSQLNRVRAHGGAHLLDFGRVVLSGNRRPFSQQRHSGNHRCVAED
jgi:MscS family membrane protein